MRIVTLDLGGSFVKSALFDTERAELTNVERSPFPSFVAGLPALYREVATEQILDVVEARIRALTALAPDCRGIFFSSQMHGFVLVDSRGRARSRFISWQDQRALESGASGSHFDSLNTSISSDDLRRIRCTVRTGHAVAVLHAMAASGSLEPGLTPLPLPNFVAHALCGDAVAAEPTLAASFGVFDVASSEWALDLAARLGLASVIWPRISKWNEPVALWDGRIPVYSPVGDQQAALCGTGLGPDELSVNVGTGSQVSAIAATVEDGAFNVHPYFDGRFLKSITHIPAGRALNVLVRLLGDDPAGVWSRVEQELAETASTDLRVDLSFFPSAFGSEGSIQNIREENLTAGHLFLAAFESMARNYETAARRLFPAGDWGPLAFSGGIAQKSERLREGVAAQLGRPYRLAGSENDTLSGLGTLALAALTGQSVAAATEHLAAARKIP